MAEILVATASWTDKTLIESGRFYPRDRTRDQLIAAGAYLVTTSLMETRDQVATLAGLVTREPGFAPDSGTAVPEPRVAAA
jgi:hypothetical protein